MEKTNLLTLAITLTVGIILAGSLLMPVINDATETERTLTNEGYYRMAQVAEDHTISWDHTAPKIITIDDEDKDLSSLDFSQWNYTIFGGYDFLMRMSSTGIQVYIGQVGATNTFLSANTTNGNDITATITTSSVEFNVTNAGVDVLSQALTLTEDTYIIDDSGDYVMKTRESGAYIKDKSSIILLMGVTRTYGTNDVSLFASGTVEDGLDFNLYRGVATYPATIESTTFDATENASYKGVSQLNKITIVVEQNSVDYNFVYSYFLVPYEITAELSQHLSSGEIAIMNAIPFMIIAALVVMAAGALYLKRED